MWRQSGATMATTMTAKEERFCFVLSGEERKQLDALASADGRSAANWLRAIIKREHEGAAVKKVSPQAIQKKK
jgi:hypothetical protein